MSEKARAVGGVKPGMIGITSRMPLGNWEKLGSPRGTTDLILQCEAPQLEVGL